MEKPSVFMTIFENPSSIGTSRARQGKCWKKRIFGERVEGSYSGNTGFLESHPRCGEVYFLVCSRVVEHQFL